MLAVAVAAVLGLTALAPEAAAGEGSTGYSHRAWGPEHGPAFQGVRDAAPSHDGRIWIAASTGLFLFDGVRTETVASVPVSCLLADRAGEAWAGGTGVVLEARPGSVVAHSLPRFAADRDVLSLSRGRDGGLLVVTHRGLFRLSRGRFAPVALGAGLERLGCFAAVEDGRGRLRVGTNVGLLELGEGERRPLELSATRARKPVATLLPSSDGTLLAGFGEGVAVLKDGAPPTLVRGPAVRRLLEDPVEGVLVATHGRGVYRVVGGTTLEPFVPAAPVRSDIVHALFRDREGSLWIASASGLHLFSPAAFRTLGAEGGLTTELVSCLLEDPDGTLWMGTLGGGLLRRAPGGQAPVEVVPGLEDVFICSLARDGEGTLWAGTAEAGVFRLSGVGGRSVAAPPGPPQAGMTRAPISAPALRRDRLEPLGERDGAAAVGAGALLVADRRGRLWIGSRGHLTAFDAGALAVHLTADDGIPGDWPTAIAAADDGAVWLAVANRVVRVAPGARRAEPVGQTFEARVTAAALVPVAGADVLVLTTGHGVLRVRPDGAAQGVLRADDTPQSGVLDARGDLWLLGDGACRRVPRELLSGREPSEVRPVEHFGLVDGLRTLRVVAPGVPSAILLRDGRIALATCGGVAFVDPSAPRRARPALDVAIESLRVDGRKVPVSPELRLSAGRKRLEIRYATRTFLAPELVRYRYRLGGPDAEWIDAEEGRTAAWPEVPPGTWRFEVEALRGSDPGSRGRAVLPIVIPPRLHERPGFLAAAALLLALAVAAAQQARLRSQRGRAAELERLVAERTRALEAAGERLARADSEIARLSAPGARVLEETERWAGAAASEMARAIGAGRVGVYALGPDGFTAVGDGPPPPPELEALRRQALPAEETTRSGTLLIPVLGLSGEPRGALTVHDGGGTLGEAGRRLVAGFARHLGSALELRDLRRRLTEAETRRGEARRSMRERGISCIAVCPRCGRCEAEPAAQCPADGSALSATLVPALVAGRYRVTARLGEGGMSTVYRARDERLGRDVALKIVAASQLETPAARFRLEREASTIARIHHPGVVALHDTGELDDGSVFLVMELLVGHDLATALGLWGAGSPRQVASLLRQAAAALGAAHRVGVIHRDIKPANVFLLPAGTGFAVKLLDFGLAKLSGEASRLTQTGFIVGTPAYMAPEQVLGRPVDERSDLYSLAVVAFEALAGMPVVASVDVAQILLEITQSPAPTLSLCVPGVPGELDTLFSRALSKEPARRPGDLEEWAVAVGRALAQLPEHPGRGWPAGLVDA